jgi:hypothetical protein
MEASQGRCRVHRTESEPAFRPQDGRGGARLVPAWLSSFWSTLKLADRYDPFYQLGFEEKFNRVRRNILKMEEEAEAERPH